MNKKYLIWLLVFEFVLLLGFVFLSSDLTNYLPSLMCLGFEQVGQALFYLASLGKVGKGLAVMLYVGLCLLPLFFGKRKYEKVVLGVLSGALFVIMYLFINPGLMDFWIVAKGILGVTLWSIIILYAVLKLLRIFEESGTGKLVSYLKVALWVLCVYFVASFVLGNLGPRMFDSWALGLRFVFELCVCILDLVICFLALDLIDEKERVAEIANKLVSRCGLALILDASFTVAVNVLQLVFIKSLKDVLVTAKVPIFSLGFVLLVLLCSRLVIENQKLKTENALFV